MGLVMNNDFIITNTGLFCGIIPVYLDMRDEDEPGVMARHWFFEPFLDGIGLMFAAADWVAGRFSAEVAVPIRITGDFGDYR